MEKNAVLHWLKNFLSRHYLILLFFVALPVMYQRINYNPRSVVWSDSEGYYKYLPTLFIIKDLHQMPEGSVWPLRNEKGEILNKYTCGVAIFELPFFFAARQYCIWKNQQPEEYFNRHYCRAVAICGLLFGFLGLGFLKRALRRRFSPRVTFWTLMSVFLGTNLFYYMTKEPGMSHAFSFFLVAFLVWHVPRFYQNPSWRNVALLGGTLGWIVLIRPTNCLVAIFVLLYDVYSRSDFKRRLGFLRGKVPKLVFGAAVGFLFFIPQMLYWHEMTGHWVHFSYTGEGFFYWKNPKVLAVFFDTQNGLFLFSPMVLAMLGGTIIGLRKQEFQSPAVLLIFAIGTYLFASWCVWNFGGAFGHRCYVEFYPMLAFPLGGIYEWVFDVRRKAWQTRSALLLALFLMYYSVRMTYLYTKLWGPWDGPKWRWNWDGMIGIWKHLFNFGPT